MFSNIIIVISSILILTFVRAVSINNNSVEIETTTFLPEKIKPINETTENLSITEENEETENSTKFFREDFFSGNNVKFPVDEQKSLSKWIKMRQLIFLLGSIGTCAILLIGFSIAKMLSKDRTEIRNLHESREFLIEPACLPGTSFENSTAAEVSSDEDADYISSKILHQKIKKDSLSTVD